MGRVLIWGFPIITFVLAFVLTLGMTNAYAESVWNWWYTLLLPGMLAIICHLSITREKKTGYYHLMTLSTSKRKLMMGKIIYMVCVTLVSDIIIFAGASLGGFLLTTCVPLGGALAAVLLLSLLNMPYGFYEFVRFAAMAAFAYLAYKEYDNKGSKDRMSGIYRQGYS